MPLRKGSIGVTKMRSSGLWKVAMSVVLGVLLASVAMSGLPAHAGRVSASPLDAIRRNVGSSAPNQNMKRGNLVHAASCEQAPPPAQRDRVTYSLAELARYGLPPRSPGEPFAKWAAIVRGAGKRICDYTTSSDHWGLSYTQNRAGNYADESTPGQTYTEADMDYFVPCIVGTPPGEASAAMGAFIGLGGANTSGPLVQTGTADFQYWDPIRGDFQDIDFEGCVNDNTSAFALAALHESSCAYDGGWRAF